MTGYTRQSSADIVPTAVVRATPLNNEFNAIRDSFTVATGHRHDGTTAEGHLVPLIADDNGYNKVVTDSTNNRIGIFVNVSSAPVEQVRFSSGLIVPVTTNAVDIGSSTYKFKNLVLSGTATLPVANIGAGTITATDLTVTGTIDVTNTVISNVSTPTLSTDAANKSYVDTSISNLINGAPSTIDTLNEIATALGNDPNFATTMTNSLAAKLSLSGGTMTGNIAMGSYKITGLGTPTTGSDATTKTYVDGILGSATAAATSASAAATSAANAATSEANAAASYDSFDDRYLGPKSANPTLDNDGNSLLTGALYFNTTANEMRVWSGSAWVGAFSGTVSLTSGVTGVLPVANGGTGLTSGTSGGVLYYSAAGTLASSAALTANALVIGGGAGVAPSVTTTATGALTFLGTPTSANLAALLTDETGSGAAVFATSPALVTPILGTPTSGNLSNCTADGTDQIGFKNIPQNAQTGSYTLVLADSGKHVYHASGAGAATYTIPAATSVAYPIGTAVTFINLSATSVSIAITTDTMYLSGAGTTGTRTLAQYGTATAIKVSGLSSTGIWVISGTNLT